MTLSLVLALVLLPLAQDPAPEDPVPQEPAARAVVQALEDVMSSARLEYSWLVFPKDWEARRKALLASVHATHALDVLAREVLGQQIEEWPPAQKSQLANALARYLASRYAALFDGQELPHGSTADNPFESAKKGASLALPGHSFPLWFRLTRTPSSAHQTAEQQGTRENPPASTSASKTGEQPPEPLLIVDAFGPKGKQSFTGILSKQIASLADGSDPATVMGALQDLADSFGRTPHDVVGHLQDGIIQTMRSAEQLGFEGRFKRFAVLIAATHELPAISRLSIKSTWSGLNADQRALFVKTFATLTVATYASNFDGYSKERFEIRNVRELGRGVQVSSVLVKSNGDEVSFVYLLREADVRWQIVNIIVDGVSDLAVKQVEYKEVIKHGGFEHLIANLNKKIDDRRAGRSD